jgi:hypothetical protein
LHDGFPVGLIVLGDYSQSSQKLYNFLKVIIKFSRKKKERGLFCTQKFDVRPLLHAQRQMVLSAFTRVKGLEKEFGGASRYISEPLTRKCV